MSYKIGIDLGGSKIEAAILDPTYNVIHRERVPTPVDNYHELREEVANLVVSMYAYVPRDIAYTPFDDTSLGICVPGTIYIDHNMVASDIDEVDPDNIRALGSQSNSDVAIKHSNISCLNGRPFHRDLDNTIFMNASMDNDANCFALAESVMGAAKRVASRGGLVFGVIMGTGVGGGITINGSIYPGLMRIAGEWGHHTLYSPGGKQCHCGKRGCVETCISGPALEQKWADLTGDCLKLQEIIPIVDKYSKVKKKTSNMRRTVRTWKQEFLEDFGVALSNVINILDPGMIVLGGGLSNIDFLYTEGKKHVYEHILAERGTKSMTPILKNKLGDSAGVIGACML